MESAEFSAVRDELQVSDSVLSKHVKVLDEAGYLRVRKAVVASRQRTWLALTADGRRALVGHVAALQRLLAPSLRPSWSFDPPPPTTLYSHELGAAGRVPHAEVRWTRTRCKSCRSPTDVSVSEARRGQIWLADFGGPVGHEQGRLCPALVLSADAWNRHASTVTVLPIRRTS